MRKLILILMLCGVAGFLAANSYIDFYVQTTGDNMNSGHTTSDTATYSATAGDFTNNTSASVCTWHKTGEDLSGVTNNAWASIYPDGATTNVYVGMVTAVDDTADTITVSLNAKAGTVPASSTAATSIKVGGAWKGPGLYSLDTNANFFPFNFAANSMTNTPTNIVCINFKNGVTYDCTNSMYHSLSGPMMFAGYTTTPRDGGKATFNGNAAAVAGFVLFNQAGSANYFKDFIFDGNGNSGAVNGLTVAGSKNIWEGCIFANMRQSGANISGSASIFLMCEAYSNNVAGTANHGGMTSANGDHSFYRCYIHHNGGASGWGLSLKDGCTALNCIVSHNAGYGIRDSGTAIDHIINCSVYSNSTSGIILGGAGPSLAMIQNCSIFNNSQYGIDNSSAQPRIAYIENCAFGSGTQTNVLGNISKNILTTDPRMLAVITNTLTYTANETPWVDPTNGNFTEKSTALTKARGSGVFQQRFVNSPTNTVSYPDIGAAQYPSTNAASGGEHSHVFAQ